MGVVERGAVRRGEVYLVDLGGTGGREIRRARPCVIVSPDEMNASYRSFIVAPLTTGSHAYPFRVPCRFEGKAGHVVLDQIRAVDGARMRRRLGKLSGATVLRALTTLQEMFAV
jgi:mRNA interferase MazF